MLASLCGRELFPAAGVWGASLETAEDTVFTGVMVTADIAGGDFMLTEGGPICDGMLLTTGDPACVVTRVTAGDPACIVTPVNPAGIGVMLTAGDPARVGVLLRLLLPFFFTCMRITLVPRLFASSMKDSFWKSALLI